MVENTITIKDNSGEDFEIKDIKSFHQHILEKHATGTSKLYEDGHWFTVDDEFRKMITNYTSQT